jgi:hypothetical protein
MSVLLLGLVLSFFCCWLQSIFTLFLWLVYMFSILLLLLLLLLLLSYFSLLSFSWKTFTYPGMCNQQVVLLVILKFLTIEHVPRIADFFCICMYVFWSRLSLFTLCSSDFGITSVRDITNGITLAVFCFHIAYISFASFWYYYYYYYYYIAGNIPFFSDDHNTPCRSIGRWKYKSLQPNSGTVPCTRSQ